MNKLFFVTLLIIIGLPDAFSESRNERREKRQEKRIEQGVESGQLDEKETARLNAGQNRIDAAQTSSAADGTISKQEKVHLNKMQKRQSRNIHRQKND